MPDKIKNYRTKTGKVLTDSDVEALAVEVEGDFDVEALKTRQCGRPSMGSAAAEVVPVRLDPELREAVESTRRTRANDNERDHPRGAAQVPRRRLTTSLLDTPNQQGFPERPSRSAALWATGSVLGILRLFSQPCCHRSHAAALDGDLMAPSDTLQGLVVEGEEVVPSVTPARCVESVVNLVDLYQFSHPWRVLDEVSRVVLQPVTP